MLHHTEENNCNCSFCSYSCAQKQQLTHHMRSCHTDKMTNKSHSSSVKNNISSCTREQPHKCTICRFATDRSSRLQEHMLHHTQGNFFKCSVCSFSTTTKPHLTQHMRNHH